MLKRSRGDSHTTVNIFPWLYNRSYKCLPVTSSRSEMISMKGCFPQAPRTTQDADTAHCAPMAAMPDSHSERAAPGEPGCDAGSESSLWRRPPWASGQGAGPSTGVSGRHCGRRTEWTPAFWALYTLRSSASGVTEGLRHHLAAAYL